MTRSRAWLVALVSASVVGCATGGTPRDRLLKRAAYDLHCTKDELSVTKLDDRTRGVRGCGRQATYVESCDRLGVMKTDCTWVLNSHGREDDED